MTVLGDRFTIERELGRGGMATVVLAHDRVLDRRVALKLLSSDLSAVLGAERFGREIRLTARLVHPNIVPLFDSGEVDGQLFYVMPFVEGETLRALLDRTQRLPVEMVVRLTTDIAEALAYAHGQGVVHRDIKPENVFVYGGRALLADFGIAKVIETAEPPDRLTSDGSVVGTVTYMSPEQAAGEANLDGRSDLYSLGCLMYEMLAGAPPYTGPSTMAVLAQHMATAVPELDAPVPPALSALVARMMAKAPDDRPLSAAAVLQSLRPDNEASFGATMVISDERPVTPSIKSPSMQLYEEGRQYWLRGMQGGEMGRDKLETALVLLERARELDPNNVLVLAGMADTIHVLGYRGFRPFEEANAESRRLRRLALSIDDSVAELHNSIAVMQLYWDDDFESAGDELRRALAIEPSGPQNLRFYAVWLKIAGRPEEAIGYAMRALEGSKRLAASHNTLGDILMAIGRYDEAIAPLRTAIRLNPKYEPALERLELASHRAGRADEALATRRALLGQRALRERLAALDDDVARFGWAAARDIDNRRELARLLDLAATENPFIDRGTSRQLSDDIICTYAELGEWKSAMDWVERGFHIRPGRLRRVLTDFPYDRRGLAADPRYAPMLRMAGLEELL